MKVLLIDDHGNVMQLEDDGNAVMEKAKDEIFYPCGNCGMVCFPEDAIEEHCRYCDNQ